MHLVQRQLQATQQLRDHFKGEIDVVLIEAIHVRASRKMHTDVGGLDPALDTGMCDGSYAVCAASSALFQVICFEQVQRKSVWLYSS